MGSPEAKSQVSTHVRDLPQLDDLVHAEASAGEMLVEAALPSEDFIRVARLHRELEFFIDKSLAAVCNPRPNEKTGLRHFLCDSGLGDHEVMDMTHILYLLAARHRESLTQDQIHKILSSENPKLETGHIAHNLRCLKYEGLADEIIDPVSKMRAWKISDIGWRLMKILSSSQNLGTTTESMHPENRIALAPVYKQIEWSSVDYLKLAELRFRLFREPFGLTYTADELAGEKGDTHLAAFCKNEPVGFVSLRTANNSSLQLRQMVVEPRLHAQGIGRGLVDLAERIAVAQGYQRIVLDAREESIGFYLKLGYRCEGAKFFFKTVDHQHMVKDLDGTAA